MNWLTNFIRPKIQSFVEPKDVPDNLWQKCTSCEGMLFHRDLAENLNVCYHCGHHLRISTDERLQLLYDNGQFKRIPLPAVPHDPLKFKDRKKYTDRLRDARSKTGRSDAIVVASGVIGGLPVVTAAFDFDFMGGSMGVAVGEAIVKAAESSIQEKAALLLIPSSGGARMQEGALSLMQMPRTTIAVNMVADAGLPYIVLLTNPTTGGVSASFAMLGDVHIAEPGATIGFAGKRVIQETIREELPEGFQTAEYLYEHGMVDMVIERKDLKYTIANIISMLTHAEPPTFENETDNGKKSAKQAMTNKRKGSKKKHKARAPKASARKAAVVKGTQAKQKSAANTNSQSTSSTTKAAQSKSV